MKKIEQLENMRMFAPETGYTGFAPNWMNKYEIGESTADNKTAPTTMLELAEGIQEVSPSQEETTEKFEYYGDKGGSQEDVVSISGTFAFTGHRMYAADDAQAFIRARLNKSGQDRIVFFRHTEPDGKVTQGNATLKGIVHTGGGANNRGNFECQITFNGVPHEIVATVPGG